MYEYFFKYYAKKKILKTKCLQDILSFRVNIISNNSANNCITSANYQTQTMI